MENADNARADRARHFHVIPFSVGSLFRVRIYIYIYIYISVMCIVYTAHAYARAVCTHISRMHPARVSRFAYASIGYADASELRNL